MAEAFAIYQRTTRIEPLVGLADVYLTEDHERQVTKSRYPVESGASLTDHAVREPDRLKIQGHTGHLSTTDPALGNQPDRPAAAWSEIDRLMNARELVEVATILGVYSNMLITRAQAPVSHQTGRDLLFTLELEQVQTEVLGSFTFDPAPGGRRLGVRALCNGAMRRPLWSQLARVSWPSRCMTQVCLMRSATSRPPSVALLTMSEGSSTGSSQK